MRISIDGCAESRSARHAETAGTVRLRVRAVGCEERASGTAKTITIEKVRVHPALRTRNRDRFRRRLSAPSCHKWWLADTCASAKRPTDTRERPGPPAFRLHRVEVAGLFPELSPIPLGVKSMVRHDLLAHPWPQWPVSLDLEVLCGGLAAIADEFVLDVLTFVQSAEPRSLNRRNVHEYIFAAVGRLNESIPLGRVEPFYISGRHHCSPECSRRAVLAR